MDSDNRSFFQAWTEKQALKDQLLDRAMYGEITGDEADAEAVRLGLGSLSRQPGPEEFCPERESHWTLPMAVAWIAYRDLGEVREWSTPFREECRHWRWQRWRRGPDGPIHEGWHLEQRSRPTLSLLGLSAALDRAEGGKPLSMTTLKSQEALWMALREGFFAATGVESESDRRVEIPALEWHELVPVQGNGEIDEVRHGLVKTGYCDVLVPSAALCGFWRKPVEAVESLPPTMPPEGDGFMPLYCAAQWFATEGGTLDFPPSDPPRWRTAYATLLAAITADKIRVVGLRSGERQVIPGHTFAGIQIDYPFEDPELELQLGTELYLRSYPYLDEQHWRGGFDDALVQKREDKWTRLMVDKADVRRIWPATRKKSTLSTGALPLSMSPIGDGYMPLYCAAEWIATSGGRIDFDVAEEQHWPPAFNALLPAIASEKVRVTGVRDDLRETVPATVFGDLRVFYPSGNADDSFLATGAPFLQSWPYNEEEWGSGFNDKIISRFEDRWTALMVEKGDVLKLWPFDMERNEDQRTGLPGRPGKAKHLVEDELRRRASEGRLAPSLAQEADELLTWLARNHGGVPRPTSGTTRNNIRDEYKRLKEGTK